MLGAVTRPHGIRGALVVRSDPSMVPVFEPGLAVVLVRPGEAPLAAKVLQVGPLRGGVRLVLDAVPDRSTAEAVVHAEVRVPKACVEALLDEDEYLVEDLLDCEVVTSDGRSLGRLVEVIATGANDVYVARSEAGEVLIPAVAHAIVEVDLDARRLTVAADALEYSGTPKPDADETPRDDAKPPEADATPRDDAKPPDADATTRDDAPPPQATTRDDATPRDATPKPDAT